jgi:phosphoglycolate phosphatase
MRVQAVLFDLDGTLVDSLATVADAMVEAFAPHGIIATREQIVPLIGAPVPAFLMEHYGLTPQQAEVVGDDYLRVYHEDYIDRTPQHEGADVLLRSLHALGITLAVVTNKNTRGAVDMVAIQGWQDLFTIVSSRETAPPKPDPEAALAVLRAMGVSPEDAAFVGDTEYDMNCARNAGLALAIGLVGERSAETLLAEGATHVVRSLTEVAAILEACE